MKRLASALALVLVTAAAGAATLDTIRLAPVRTIVTPVKLRPIAIGPKTPASKMDRPGPVSSPDPYFTFRIDGNDVYRDAKDPSLAYYRPILKLAKRAGTPLAEGVGELAATLDAFRFRYYRFESGGNPKWGDLQVVVIAEKPAAVTLEAVQRTWPSVHQLVPLPFRLDATTGVRMTLPYPPRAVTFSQLALKGGADDAPWYHFSTNLRPTPPQLLTDADNNVLNEAKVRDFASLITSDLGDMPSFQPVLEVKATYPGWSGRSPLMIDLIRPMPRLTLPMTPSPAPRISPAPRYPLLPFTTMAAAPVAPAAVEPRVMPRVTPVLTPATIRPGLMVRPDLIRVIGTLKPREDIDYTYSDRQEIVVRLPISYPKAKTPDYDYYFLSDSGRFGGPYFEPSAVPNRPQLAASPAGFTGTWYESHSFGKRLIWAAPPGLRLQWEVESGLRPSCRFSLTSDEAGKLTAHLTYDLFPDMSMRQLAAATAEMARRTGEQVDLLPFPDLIDANRIVLASGSPALRDLVAAKRVSVTKLSPAAVDDAWLRVSVDLPVDDWTSLTLFMRAGDLGTWDCGLLTGATTGMAEKVTFQLNGDLLQTIGGPVVAHETSYDAATGAYEVSLDNYGVAPVAVKGIRFLLTGATPTTADVWLDGKEVNLPGVGSASSFDQKDGAGGSIGRSVKADAAPDLKALMDTGKYQGMMVALTGEMVGPSTAAEDAGGADPDILFSFLRSLCYQYVGSSEIIQVPVGPAELSQWADYRSGSVVLRFQGFVYTRTLDLAGTNRVDMRRIPREGAYASAGKPGDADLLEYRAVFVKQDGTVVNLPAQEADQSRWLTGDITGVNFDMTQAR
jgi:hypothetical protein